MPYTIAMSLYLKYRPQNFADITGQDHIVKTLEQAIQKDKIAHAYLFTGTRGTGKTSTARILAKQLMTKGITEEVIARQIIEGIENGSLVDLIEIDGASNRNIDDIRSLKEQIQFSPVVASAKVYIIDEVHMFTKEAFNALLKTLEEPPKYAYFILATTELHKIPATIQSRCQTFPFRRISEQDLTSRLQFIADSEKITIDREAVRAIAHHVQGGMRDAISLLDQLQSIPNITIQDVHNRTGNIGIEHLEAMWEAIHTKNEAVIIETVAELEQQGIPLDAFVRQLLHKAQTELHTAITNKTSITGIQELIGKLLQAIIHLRTAPMPSLALEHALLSLTQDLSAGTKKVTPKAEATSTSKVVPEPTAKIAALDATPVTKEASKPVTKAESPIKPATFMARDIELTTIKTIWPDLVKNIEPASVRMSLKDAELMHLEGNRLTLGFSSSFHKSKIADPAASRTIEEELKKQLKSPISIKCTEEVADHVTPINDADMVNVADAASEIF